jgi:rhamnosyltransferase
MTIGVAIPVLNGALELPGLLSSIADEGCHCTVLVIDSGSTDATSTVVAEFPSVRYHRILRTDFNHGATRELARKILATDITVFLTQDVRPLPGFLRELVEPILNGDAVVTYARQLPHVGADIFEAFPREYNYGRRSHARTIADTALYGVYTFFCSDSCAAYSNAALDKVGGFIPTLTNEDYFATARLLQAGGTISYVAEAQVHHSHRYSLAQEFKRYFDTGYVRAENPWVTVLTGQAEMRGSSFAKALFGHLSLQAPWLLPYAFVQTAIKWIGYRAGFFSYGTPAWWCRMLSSQRYYWDSQYFSSTSSRTSHQ